MRTRTKKAKSSPLSFFNIDARHYVAAAALLPFGRAPASVREKLTLAGWGEVADIAARALRRHGNPLSAVEGMANDDHVRRAMQRASGADTVRSAPALRVASETKRAPSYRPLDPQNQLDEISIHESGHAAAAVACGLTPSSASVGRSTDGNRLLGVVSFASAEDGWPDLFCTVGGVVAQAKFTGQNPYELMRNQSGRSRGDRNDILAAMEKYFFRPSGDNLESSPAFAELVNECWAFFGDVENWGCVRAFAMTLRDAGTLDGERLADEMRMFDRLLHKPVGGAHPSTPKAIELRQQRIDLTMQRLRERPDANFGETAREIAALKAESATIGRIAHNALVAPIDAYERQQRREHDELSARFDALPVYAY